MSTISDDRCDFDDDRDDDEGFRDEESSFTKENQFSSDEERYQDEQPPPKHEERYQGSMPRHMRPMRSHGPPFRSGPRNMYQPGFRGPHRAMHMHGGNRGMPFMRSGMMPNRGNVPYDNYGPPMGMPRNYPPRFSQPYPRYPPSSDDPMDDQMEDPHNLREMSYPGHCGDAPPGAYPGMPHMRMRGPPPYGVTGKNLPLEHGSVMPPGTPGHGGPQFNGPPGHFSGPPGPPFSGGPYGTPPGAPFSAPPGSFNGPPPGPYGGPPCDPSFNMPPTSHSYGMPPRPTFTAPTSGSQPSPTYNGTQYPAGSSGPPTSTTSNATDATGTPGPVAPPDSAQSSCQPSMPMTSTAPSNFPFSGAAPQASDGSYFGLPPPGFPPMPTNVPRPILVPPVGVPGMPPSTPGIPSLPMMGPPPMPTLAPFPPAMSFRPPMSFMSSAMPVALPPTPVPTRAPDDIWVENLSAEGKSYYYNMRTRETRWDRPEGVTVVRQGEVEGNMKSISSSTVVPPNFHLPTLTSAQSKPPDVAVWTEYHNPEGKAYYHNAKTGETTWEKPKVLIDWENQQNMPKTEQPTTSASVVNYVQVTAENKQSTPQPAAEDYKQTAETKPAEVKNEKTASSVDKEETETKVDANKSNKDNTRPVSSTAVHGTPWCVVWTGDGRAFFFNPSQRLSVWEKPEELKGRADVDRLLEKQPGITPTQSPQDGETNLNNTSDGDDSASAPKKARLESDDAQKELGAEASQKIEAMDEDGDKPSGTPEKIPVGMEAAKEAEEKAARERAVQPLEVRVRRFREMLVEMQVSAFSTWEKELHKIVFDPRYLLLASKERKQTFEAYVKERAEEERREKKSKLKERKERFTELLEEASLSSKSLFSDFAAKYSRDDRFKGIEKSRDREAMFQDYLLELRKREKEEKHREKEKIRLDFISLLKEQKSLSRHSHWSDVKRKLESDPRYKAIESSSRREDLFREYVRKLDESADLREDSYSRKEREKKERQEASLREREKEVKEALSSSLREREKEREQHLRAEQEEIFRTMLSDLIRDPGLTWKEAKKILRKDSRWEDVSDVLQRSEREELFKDYIAGLSKKSRDMFHKLLNETDGIPLDISWKEFKKLMQSDVRFEKILTDKKRESDFLSWREMKKEQAMEAFKDLLRETKLINNKTKRTLEENESHIGDILEVLEKDKRFVALDAFQEERNALIEDYIDSLDKKCSQSSKESSRR